MKKQIGFTLIELMIVVAIISILAAVAYPSYVNQTKKARRSDAQQLMLDISNREEQYLLDVRAYTNNPTNMSIAKEDWACTTTACTNDFYDVTIALTSSNTAFTITATAKGPQLDDGNLTLTHTGTKTHKGATGW
jgi:type IV pilus assembly protein PilE